MTHVWVQQGKQWLLMDGTNRIATIQLTEVHQGWQRMWHWQVAWYRLYIKTSGGKFIRRDRVVIPKLKDAKEYVIASLVVERLVVV